MLRPILIYGLAGGLIVGAWEVLLVVGMKGHSGGVTGMVAGYLAMLVALSTVFLAIKRQRDDVGGGAIRFWPALALGLGVSTVASVLYVVSWEVAQAVAHLDFGAAYSQAMVRSAHAQGLSGPALAKAVAEAEHFRAQYADPLFRLPMTFVEIFPVGVLVSLVSAALLRNSRFLPPRRPAPALA